MKKIFALSICLFMLASCEYEELFEASEYPVQNYEISNAADGVYSIKYQERTGFPDQCVDVEVKKSDDIVYKYSTDWKGDRVLPEKIVHLFEYDGGDVFYIQNYTPEPYGNNVYEPECYIVYNGNERPDFFGYKDYVNINFKDNIPENRQEELESAAEFLNENITEQEIVEVFDKCGYDSTYILKSYNYKGEKENDQT